jgi:hypothetical protein
MTKEKELLVKNIEVKNSSVRALYSIALKIEEALKDGWEIPKNGIEDSNYPRVFQNGHFLVKMVKFVDTPPSTTPVEAPTIALEEESPKSDTNTEGGAENSTEAKLEPPTAIVEEVVVKQKPPTKRGRPAK